MSAPRRLPDPEPRDCARCGETFTPRRKSANLGQRYCGRDCARRARTDDPDLQRQAAQAPRPNGRAAKPKGYKKRGQRHEHRTVVERKLGRPLKRGEVVHHRDGDPHNNHPDNLQVLSSQGKHINMHRTDLEKGKAAKVVTPS